MSWPEDALTEGEEIVSQFRPHWKLLVVPLLWFLLGLALIVSVVEWIPGSGAWNTVPILLVLVGFVFLVVRPVIAWSTTHYVLTTERLITRRGLIARHGVEIPLENITNVNFHQTAFERLLGAGDLVVESAGETGISRFLDIPHPDRFQAVLYKVRERRTLQLKGVAPQPPAPPAPDAAPASERLRALAELHREGLISDEEFEEKRRRLLDEL